MFPIRDELPSRITPVATYSIIALCTIVLLLEFSSSNLDSFISTYALIPRDVDFSSIDTLFPFISAIFLHAGFWHFFSNMWFLRIFGDNVEADLGPVTYVLFYLAGGIVAGLAEYYFIADSNIPMLGASGAIAAVLGYYFVRFPSHKVQTLIPAFVTFITIRLPAQFVLAMWFITQLFNGTASFYDSSASAGVAWWAHIGGFVFGVLVALFLKNNVSRNQTNAEYPDQIIYRSY